MAARLATRAPGMDIQARACRATTAIARPPRPRSTATHRFIHLSFEGPDPYSMGGGLGIRVDELTRALARTGAAVDLYFIGDPDAPGVESRSGVTLRRWSQAISAQAPAGVYDEEEAKIEDWCIWLPGHIAELVDRDLARGVRPVVLAEDWHTAWPLIAIHDELLRRGTRDSVVLVWTANNRFGFHRLDFERLRAAATIVTISRAMKHLLWQYGVNPLVVPNGITDQLLSTYPCARDITVRDAFAHPSLILTKVGRWDPDKRWPMALDAVAEFRDRGQQAVLLARGWNGSAAASAHHDELRARASHLGLEWSVCPDGGTTDEALVGAVRRHAPRGSGVLELAFPISGRPLQALYQGADVVLANSGFEPFGLVGLEAMASRALVITGATGEDYLVPFHNGIALDTDDPAEIVRAVDWVAPGSERSVAMRGAAYDTACRYRWDDVVERLLLTLGLVRSTPTAH